MRRSAQFCLIYILEGLAIVMALVIFGLAGILWRLASGPVEVDLIRPIVTERLIEAFEGDVASIGTISVGFNPDYAALVLSAEDISVARRGGEVMASVDYLQVGLALDLLFIGEFSPVSLEAQGGVYTVGRTGEGQFHAQFGTGDDTRGFSLTPDRQEGAPELPIDNEGVNPVLETLLEDGTAQYLPRLRYVDIQNADIRVFDQVSDFVAVINDTAVYLARESDHISLSTRGDWLTSAGVAPVEMRFETGARLETLLVDIRVENLVPASIAPRQGLLEPLSQIQAPVGFELVLDASREGGLGAVMIQADVGAGDILRGDRTYQLQSAGAHLSYDTLANQVDIHHLSVDAELLDLDITGRFYDFADFETSIPQHALYELNLAPGRFEWPGFFRDPIVWNAINLAGDVAPMAPAIGFERFDIDLDKADAQFTGQISLSRVESGQILPNVALNGPIQGNLTPDDVLGFWPVNFALGARDWIVAGILGGRLYDAHLDMNLRAQALADRALVDEDLNLSFKFENADVRYVSTMTPLRGISGEATLYGNGFELTGQGGSIGNLQMETAYVSIPEVEPKGGPAHFGGVGIGPVPDFLALIDEEPLGFVSDYGLNPRDFNGEGRLNFAITRPMLTHVPSEDVGFDIQGEFENIDGPLVFSPTGAVEGAPRIEQGRMTLTATPDRLVGEGTAIAAGIPSSLKWEELFKTGEDVPGTRLHIEAQPNSRDLNQFGLPVRRYLDGPLGLVMDAVGEGTNFQTVEIQLDLTETAISAPLDLWQKAPGQAAQSRLALGFTPEGFLIDSFSLQSQGAEIQAQAEVSPDGQLKRFQADRLFLEGILDLSVRGERPEGLTGPLELAVTGPYLNAMNFIEDFSSQNGPAINSAPVQEGDQAPTPSLESEPPIQVEASIDAMDLRGVRFTNIDFLMTSYLMGVEQVALSAHGPGGPVELYFQPNEAGTERTLSLSGGSAGTLLTAATGFSQIEGGNLVLNGRAPLLGQSGPITGEVSMESFRLVRMPLLARILAAGSFEGLGSLFSGEGLIFDRFNTDFVWDNETLEMRNSRAVGPALGITWDGVVRLGEERLDVDGTILPSYGTNSILGGLPVLGDLITGRRGEGIFGVIFSVEGPFSSTRVFVNPISALAPGVLRRIFEGTSAERELEALEAARQEGELQRELREAGDEVQGEVQGVLEELQNELTPEPGEDDDPSDSDSEQP